MTGKKSVEHAVAALLNALDLDAADDAELTDTPRRVAELMERWLRPAPMPKIEPLEEAGRTGEIVAMRDMTYHAFCAHHLVPFFGTVSIAYQIDSCIIGFGAIPRLIESASRGPNLQERLGGRIVDALEEALRPQALLVKVTARQMCVELSECRSTPETDYVVGRGAWSKDPARHASELFGIDSGGS